MTAFRTALSTQVKGRALETAIEAIAISDMLGNLTYVNPALLSLWEYASMEDVLGRPIADFWVTAKSSSEMMQSVLDKGVWKGELTAKRRSGTPFDVFVSASIVRDTFGAPLCLVAEFEDVSGRKRNEERIRRLFSFPELNPNPILEIGIDGNLQTCQGPLWNCIRAVSRYLR
jgi:PAS domain S-box-containing protein